MTKPSAHVSLKDALGRTYNGKRVFITGHNGFVGSWLAYTLLRAGADITGYSLPQLPGGISEMLSLKKLCQTIEGDIRDLPLLEEALKIHEPEIVFHLAAQPLVIPSFDDPIGTLSTNVIGTANVLEAVRKQPSVKACVVITSDKCYATAAEAHEESDPVGGDDIYSASKGAAELVVHAYRHSFFRESGLPVATARAGNIIGGGDWAEFRIVPDVIRAIHSGQAVRLRQPSAIRPWQHVLDAVAGYLLLGDALLSQGAGVAEGWNFGPAPDATVTVGQLVNSLVTHWRNFGGEAKDPVFGADGNFSEREYLTLLSSKAKDRLGWDSRLSFDSTLVWTAEWYFQATSQQKTEAITEFQIANYLDLDSLA